MIITYNLKTAAPKQGAILVLRKALKACVVIRTYIVQCQLRPVPIQHEATIRHIWAVC